MARMDRAQAIAAAQGLPAAVREVIAEAAVAALGDEKFFSYYSKVRFQATLAVAASVTTFTMPAGTQASAFAYGLAGSMQPAGFPAARLAGFADTNIPEARKTRDGETVYVHGLSLIMSPESEPALAKQLFSRASIVVQRAGGTKQDPIGPLSVIPGCGGLYGGARSLAVEPDAAGGEAVSFASNAWPSAGNIYALARPIIWTPSGETDSSFQLALTVEQAFQATTATAAGAFVPPVAAGELGSFVDLWVVAHVRTVAKISENQ